MNSSESFSPIIDLDRCDGCGDCVKVCPTGALELVAGFATLVALENCAYCADCEERCPQRAIALPYEIVVDCMD
jgi:NAD-dependent dihydropyrimidine dehydrogenase PreA subunit